MVNWFKCWLFMMQMRYCSCDECYGRYLFKWPSWTLEFFPVPGPRLALETCRASIRVYLMWFRLVLYRRGYEISRF